MMPRTITGLIVPYGEPGSTNHGAITFARGALSIPNDMKSVKLLRDHSTHGGGPVGVLASWHATEEGVFATFNVPPTTAGDEALIEAQSVRDRMSIEVEPIERNGPVVTRAILKAVALVPYPAYKKAKVSTVNASDTSPGLILAEDHQDYDTTIITGADPLAGTTPAGAGASSTSTQDVDVREDQAPPAAPAAPAPQLHAEQHPPAPAPSRPAVVPAGLSTHAPASSTALEFEEVVERIMTARAPGGDADILAELVDITNSANLSVSAPSWLGELWSGITYQRRIVPLLTGRALRSWRAVGYRWTTKPRVGPYAGDKADIPSFPAATEPVEVTAKRWAGGNDIDRKFFDFNDREYLAAYWRAMAESYAIETDSDAAAFLNANATAYTGTFTDPVRAITAAGIQIDQTIHSQPTYAIVNPADLPGLLDVSQLEAPYYGDMSPIGNPSRWTTSNLVTAGSAIVGHKAAVEHFELTGSPLRAEAQHIAKGGYDAALFGYTAMLLTRPEALLKVSWTAAPAGA